MILRMLPLLLCVALAGCITTQFQTELWPDSAPPQDYFEALFAADPVNSELQSLDDYLLWIVRYYEGWELYGRGWKHVTRDVLVNVSDPDERTQLRTKMADLGRSIAGEWAKKSPERRIRTEQLSVWGNALLQAVEQGEQLALIQQIRQDVDYLLHEQVSLSEITPERYYAQDPNDWFR